MRQAKGLGGIVHGAFATRGFSSDADGSSAPSHQGRLALFLASLAAIAALMALSPLIAGARTHHPFLETFGSANQPSFTDARGVAIYQATGDVYVMDNGSPPSIKRYNADGSPDDFSALSTNAIDGKEGADATPGEGFSFPSPSESQIAVDNSGGATDGNIYVTQNSPNAINIFSSTGAYLGQLTAAGTTNFTEACGVAVDPSGAVYVGDFASGIYKFVPSANPPTNADETAHFTTTSLPCTLAAGAGATAGFLFPARYFGSVSKIDSSTGEVKYSFSSSTTTLSVDPATGHVYALKGSEFIDFDASGVGSATEASSDTLASGGRGIAVRGSTGDVYVSRGGAAMLEVFGPLATVPDVSVQAATGITADEATLHGTVNPDGVEITECKFEYGPTSEAGYSGSVPCEQAVPTDSSDHAVSADISGLGAGGAEYRFRLVAKNANASEASAPETFRIITPTVTAQAVTGITATGATLNGTVNPNGFALTECKFEYGLASETGYAHSVPCEQAVPTDSSDHAVSADISGLSAGGTQYRFRLVAKNAGASEASDPETFRVGATIVATTASVGIEEATLLGAIIPGGDEASYEFEWGTTSAYGNTTTPGSLPAGEEPVAVEVQLTGLTPGQTYHYRLLATDGAGTTQGPDQTFTTAAGPPQMPQRGYEIASQYPTGGVPITVAPVDWLTASEDGNSIAVTTPNPLAHSTLTVMPDDPPKATAGGEGILNVFTRGSDDWERTEVGLGGESWSGDLQRLVTSTEAQAPGSGFIWEDARTDPDDQNRSMDLYQWQPDGKLTWISRDPRIPVGTPQTVKGEANLASEYSGVSFATSADGRTVLFKSQRQLLDADTTPASAFDEPFRLYKWDDGQLSFIGVRPDGSVPTAGSELGDYYYQTSDRYAVSRDGSRVIFSALRRHGVGSAGSSGSTGAALYVQTDGQPTVEATKEEGVPPLPAPQPYAVTYRGAASDDSRVFFTSASRFTPDSGSTFTGSIFTGDFNHDDDLYVYDVEADKLRDLTPRLDGLEDPSVDPPLADRARVLGVAANSEDGKRVYFVAEGQYPTAPNPEGELPQASSPNLYMAELDSIDGSVKLRFIATLSGAKDSFGLVLDKGDWQAGWSVVNGPGNVNGGKTALASADGSVLGFGSRESLTGQPLGGTEQLFVYDAERGRLECASCPSDGTLPAADVNGLGVGSGVAWQGRSGAKRWVSSDGTVFFTTLTPLLAADENNVTDIYEFHKGELRLITTGKGTTNSVLTDASVDGSTVFFNTQEALVPQDKEPGINKIYAARVGGGFPYTPPPAPCDFNAGACEGATSTTTETPGAGTAAFEGPGDPKPNTNRSCPKGKRKVRRSGKVRCVKKRHSRAHHKRHANHNRRAGR
jgi:hypothetical protein